MYIGDYSLIKVRDIRYGSITPQALKIIQTAHLRHKNMNKSVIIINHNPLGIAIAVIIIRLDMRLVKDIFTYTVGNRCYVLGGRTLTYHKTRGCRAFYAA